MVEGVLKTKMKFFEENTNGRILNRFSKDVGVLDSIVYTYLDLTDVKYFCITIRIVHSKMSAYCDSCNHLSTLGFHYNFVVFLHTH